MNLSGSSDRWKFCRKSQRRRYWMTTGTVRAKVMSRIQRWPESASRTERDFLILGGTAFQRSGANWRIEHPLSQRSDQNKAREPSPTCTVTDASKKAWADRSALKKYLDQFLSESTRSSHSQRRRNANPISCRLGMPRPPYCNGQAAFTQATAHLPPTATSDLHQRNPRTNFSIARMAQGAIFIAIEMCTGMAQSIDQARMRRPLLFSILPFQGDSRLATLSTTGCMADLGRRQGESGTPR
jgi:hypothetical protein